MNACENVLCGLCQCVSACGGGNPGKHWVPSLSLHTLFFWGLASPWTLKSHLVFSRLEASKPFCFHSPLAGAVQLFCGCWEMNSGPHSLLLSHLSGFSFWSFVCRLQWGSAHNTLSRGWLNLTKGHSWSFRGSTHFTGVHLTLTSRKWKGQVCRRYDLSCSPPCY